jgi:hypothetical protein
VSKTRRARWVQVPPVLLEAVCGLVPATTAPLSGGCSRVRRRPVPHGDYESLSRRRRADVLTPRSAASRISLLHLSGVPWARIGEHVGQRNLAVTANTYSHVLADEAELNYANLLACARTRPPHAYLGARKAR